MSSDISSSRNYSKAMEQIIQVWDRYENLNFKKAPEDVMLVKYIINIDPKDLNRRDVGDLFGYTLIIALIEYYTPYSIPLITCLINKGADINLGDKSSDYSPLYHAAKENRLDVVKLLIEKGAKTNIVSSVLNKTPYDVAIAFKNAEVANYLSK